MCKFEGQIMCFCSLLEEFAAATLFSLMKEDISATLFSGHFCTIWTNLAIFVWTNLAIFFVEDPCHFRMDSEASLM